MGSERWSRHQFSSYRLVIIELKPQNETKRLYLQINGRWKRHREVLENSSYSYNLFNESRLSKRIKLI